MSYGSHLQNQLDNALAREYGLRKRLEATEDELVACKSESDRLKDALERVDIELTQTMRDWKNAENQRDEYLQCIVAFEAAYEAFIAESNNKTRDEYMKAFNKLLTIARGK